MSSFKAKRLRKKSKVSVDVLTLAKERIADAYKMFDHISVSFSGGKDSTVCLNLAYEVSQSLNKTLDVFTYDEEAIPYETEDYCRRVANLPGIDFRWYCLPVKHRNGCSRTSPFWWPWAPESKDLWVRELPPEAITTLKGFPMEPSKRLSIPDTEGLLFDPKRYGRVGVIMGIRAAESVTRLGAILARSPDHAWIRRRTDGTEQGNLWKVYPIYDWMTSDVWTAPKKFGWDYNAAYDRMEQAGVTHHDQRCAPPYGEEPMAGLYRFAICFPDIWDRMSVRVPGAATAARYARTELYAYKSRPKKPKGMPWPEFIKSFVRKHGDYAPFVAKRIQSELRLHRQKTDQPLAEETPHPLTGLCWNSILMLAMRGDFKQRKNISIQSGDAQGRLESAVKSYNEEIERMRANGDL